MTKKDVADMARSFFYFVRDRIKYNPRLPKLRVQDNRASEILKRGEGYCVQKVVLLAALARGSGIPARLRFADILNHRLPEHLLKMRMGSNLFVYHGYNELYIDGRWIKADDIISERKRIHGVADFYEEMMKPKGGYHGS